MSSSKREFEDWYRDNKEELIRRWNEYGKRGEGADLIEFYEYEFDIACGEDLVQTTKP